VPALLPSELPVVARTRHHWVVLLRRPHWVLASGLVVLLLAAAVWPWPMALVFALAFGSWAFVRWQTWNAESVIITQRRVVRVRGVPETTSTEASLRLDRISGVVLEQTVPGKLLDYGTIELEAPGSHPDVRKLVKIERPNQFYLQLRWAVFGEPHAPDPNEDPKAFVTAPIPRVRTSALRRHR
jgi:Bacterial PH domain